MYKLDVVVDTKEAAALERRRNMEKQRQSRIFNARERTIGVRKTVRTFVSAKENYGRLRPRKLDLPTLDKQVMERKVRENTEKYRHEAYGTKHTEWMIKQERYV